MSTSAESPSPSALFAAAAAKSALVWVGWDGHPPKALWHLWSDGASLLVVGGGEQAAPGLARAGDVRVSVRSSASGARLVTLRARVELLAPESAEWDAAAPLLAAARLNAEGGPDAAVARWREESELLRLVPTEEALEEPSAPDPADGRAVPPPLPAAAPRDPRLARTRDGGHVRS